MTGPSPSTDPRQDDAERILLLRCADFIERLATEQVDFDEYDALRNDLRLLRIFREARS